MPTNKIHLTSPTQAEITTDISREKLEKSLTYIDKRVDFQLKQTTNNIKRLKRIPGLSEKPDLVARIEALETLQAQLKKDRSKTLLSGESPNLRAPSGLIERLVKTHGFSVERTYTIPEPATELPMSTEHQDRDYQKQAHDLLLQHSQTIGGPCGIELATGGGKTTIIRNLVRTLGLGTTIMAPSKSIAHQIFDELVRAFGARYVGFYGDSKKDFKRLITVGIDDSLTRIEEGSPAWKKLSENKVFIADESHLCPSTTLAKVCYGLAAKASYRFFFSGTQMRNDGLDLVLEGITGPIVMRKNVKELVDSGYLAKPSFKLVKVRTTSSRSTPDINVMTRQHLYYNRIVNQVAADLANRFVEQMRRPTIILVEELEQFGKLLPGLRGRVGFAHGPLTATTKELVPEAFQDPSPAEMVEAFNAGRLDVLVGTSCIATGTDIKVAEAAIYLMGGKSEIKIRQGVGRGTRGGIDSKVVNPWTGKQKLDFVHVDFDVIDPVLDEDELADFSPHRHAVARASVYRDIYREPDVIDMTHLT